jgi:hypothetical protein
MSSLTTGPAINNHHNIVYNNNNIELVLEIVLGLGLEIVLGLGLGLESELVVHRIVL